MKPIPLDDRLPGLYDPENVRSWRLTKASWAVLQRCLDHRAQLRTDNPHVIVTRGTKALQTPASTAYCAHLLDAAGVAPHRLRVTRLADLVNTMDPKLVAESETVRAGAAFHFVLVEESRP